MPDAPDDATGTGGLYAMLWWLETQETPVIVLIVFTFCYLLAIVMLLAGAALSAHPIAGKVNATTPAMLTPLGVITGLVIAFLAARVWANVDRANAYVAQEATAIRQVVLLSEVLPADLRTTIRNDIKQYLQFVDAEDWPEMLEGRNNLRRPPPGLPEALIALLSFEPQRAGEKVAQQDITRAIEGHYKRGETGSCSVRQRSRHRNGSLLSYWTRSCC